MPDQFPKAPKGTAYERLFQTLTKAGSRYAGATAKGGLFVCPIHDDANASLQVDEGSKGIPLISCPPCEARIGHVAYMDELRFRGVRFGGERLNGTPVEWGERAEVPSGGGSHGVKGRLTDTHRLDAVYTYRHKDGTDNFKVKRYVPRPDAGGRKVFLPYRWESGAGWVKGLDGVERTPLSYDRFDAWRSQGRLALYLVEGEKAAKALHGIRKPATTFHGGCKKEPEPDWVTRYGFDRWDEVRLWPDADEVGVAWMRRRAAELESAGVKVSWWGDTDCEAEDDAFDVLGRKRKPRRLTPAEVNVLSDKKPAEKATSKEGPSSRSEGLKVAGKVITSAKGWEAESDESDKPFSVSVTQQPYTFAKEVIERWFTAPSGVKTLRYHADKTFWLWSEKKARYILLTEDEVKAHVKALLEGCAETFMSAEGPEMRDLKVNEKIAHEVVAHIRSLTLCSDFGGGTLILARGGVPFRNGWLDVATGELQPIGPERDVRWNVPMDYDPNGGSIVEWEKFLESIGWGKGTEEYRLLRQWFGYLLSGSKAQQKALLLVGPTRSGKGTILSIAGAMLGDGSVGTQMDMLADKNGLENIVGKGLVTVGDARFAFRTDKGLMGKLLSLIGDDEMTVNAKYRNLINVRLDARLMLATNELPTFNEASDALARRLIVLHMTPSFLGREDLGLRDRLIGELPGIVNWALEGYQELVGLGSFSQTETGRQLQNEMVEDAAPVRTFVDECCVLGANFKITNDDLYEEYRMWCERNGQYQLASNRFSRDLLTAFDGRVANHSFKIGGKSVRGKIGIRVAK